METNTTIIRKDGYFLLELMDSLDKEWAQSFRVVVEKDPTNPKNVRKLKRRFDSKLPSFHVERYLSGDYEHTIH